MVERETEDGMVSIQLRLLPEEAARFIKALEVVSGGNRADGAVALAETALVGGARERSVRPPVGVVVHVQAANLEGRTELGDGVSAETSRQDDRRRAEDADDPGGAPAGALASWSG